MARKFIDNVVAYLPKGIQGNRPGASSKWIATYIQILSEQSMEEAENFSVISLDLTKAYNLLAREMLKRTNRTFGTPIEVIDSYFAFLDAVQRSFLVYGTLSSQQSSKTGVPEGCAFAVYNMLQLNWVVSTYLDMRQEEQSSVTFISYVDNWLMHSYHLSTLREAYDSVYHASEAFGFVISPGKTWASSTSKDFRKALKSWFPQNPGQVVQHKQELGCLLRFSKQPSIQDALPRWEDGLYRIDRLIHQKWNTARKIQVIRQGVFPQLFSGCRTFHISLSTFKKFRAKLNVAVHGKKTRGSHYLSPVFTHLLDCEPFLYVFATRLSSLRSTVMSFQTPAREAWNYARNFDLNAQYQRVLGPISAFIWGCQVLSWQCNDDFMVVTDEGETLHLLQSPLQRWEQSCKHSWMKFIMSRCHFVQSWPEIWVPFRTWESLWSSREGPPSLATKFRTLGLLTASAVASVQQRDNPMCGDDPNGGQLHIAAECRAFRDIRDAPENNLFWEAHPFTQCTGIPCRARPAEPLPEYISQPNDSWTGHAFIFTDGSASPPELPQARLSSWSAVAARDKLAPIYIIVSGLTPGIYHDICRAETFTVLQAVMAFQGGIIFCDNASVVATWNNILSSNLDMFTLRGHPNYDLWTQIISLLVAKGPGNFSVQKIKAHRSHEEASGAEDNWLIAGNEKADGAAKQALFQGKLHHGHPIWSASDERKLVQQAKACGQFLSRVTQHAMSLRKAREPHHREEHDVEARVLPEEQILVQRPVPRPWSFPNSIWDPNWLLLTHVPLFQ